MQTARLNNRAVLNAAREMAADPAAAAVVAMGKIPSLQEVVVHSAAAVEGGNPNTMKRALGDSSALLDDLMMGADESGARGAVLTLRKRGLVIKPPRWAAVAVNMIMHVLVLWAVLTILYDVLVAKEEQFALQGQFTGYARTNLRQALEAADAKSDGALADAVVPVLPVLRSVRRSVPPSVGRSQYNSAVVGVAYVVVGALCLFFVGALLMLGGGVGVPVARLGASTLIHNLALLIIMGAAEGLFFWFVGRNLIPEPPSSIITSLLTSLQTSLAAEAKR